jgi:hypothetical protein
VIAAAFDNMRLSMAAFGEATGVNLQVQRRKDRDSEGERQHRDVHRQQSPTR